MKKLFLIPSIIVLFSISGLPAFAITSGATNSKMMLIQERKPTIKEAIKESRMENLQQRAEKEIDRRITSLTNVNDKISSIKKLTDAQKTELQTNIQSQITSLNSLKTKIQGDTDLQTLREDTKSIVSSYRIYLLYLPVTRIAIGADGILNTADKLIEVAGKLQTKITEAKNKGENTTSLETTLADMLAKINDAKTQANNAINAVSALQTADYPGNKSTLQNTKTMLRTAFKDLQTARQDAHQIIEGLRKLNKTTGTPTAQPSTQPTESN